MAVLLNHHEEALKDVNRQQVKAGATVVDVLFVDGIARGTNTIPQQKGDDILVLIDWLGPNASGKPRSRSSAITSR